MRSFGIVLHGLKIFVVSVVSVDEDTDMAQVARYIPIETPYGWMVSIPPKLTESGKRSKKYFKTETEANTFAKKLRARHESGMRGGLISAQLALEATEAQRILDGSGLSLIEAARLALASNKAENPTETFRQRYTRMLLACELRWSNRYARDMGKMELWIGKQAMDRKCAEFSQGIVEKYLREHGAASLSTIHNRSLMVNAVLNFKDRHRRSSTQISILTPEQVAAVLEACTCQEERWAVALLVFAGIRPDAEDGEISRLEWQAIGDKEIYMAAEITKTGTDRHIPITPRLRRELRGHPKTGPVVPPNWKRRWQAIRKESGIAHLQDVLRHTFGSYFLARSGEDETKQAMGHARGSGVLFSFYRRAVTKKEGVEFFR